MTLLCSSFRFREGLQTLGVFEQVLHLTVTSHSPPSNNQQHKPSRPIQVQLFPAAFCSIFCKPPAQLTAKSVSRLFTVNFSEQEQVANKEQPVIAFWRHFLLECEGSDPSL